MHGFKFHSELKMQNNPIRLYIAFLLPQRKKKKNTNIKTYPQRPKSDIAGEPLRVKIAKNLIRKSIDSFDSALLPSSHNVFLNHLSSATDFSNASISAKATILAGCDKNLIS